MNHLNKNQLAFILDIKAEDARAKMCHAWCTHEGIENKAFRNEKEKIEDDYPEAMPIEILASQLNLPTLQQSVDDIVNNYLNRPASKKWILCDYPEKEIEKGTKAGKPLIKLNIPKALRSMVKQDVQKEIKKEWHSRYHKEDSEGRVLITVA
jgi:hypothetical protein